MSMTRREIVVTAAGGSALLLGGAFMFQIAGYPPCTMCIWQRWPHLIAAIIGIIFIVVPTRFLAYFGAFAAATTAAIGLFHAGVEQDWWEGPTTCTSGDIAGLTPEQLLDRIMNAPLVRCDEIAWQLAGISMAGWNAVISLFLMGLWLVAARRSA